MSKTHQVTFDFEDFNTSTRRGPGPRKHEMVTAHKDIDGGVFVRGDRGCSKTCPDVRGALLSYLGGRELLSFREFN